MSPFKILIGLGLMCWSTIVLGFRRGWVKRDDVFDYVITLMSGEDANRRDIPVIAGGEYLSDEELLGLLLQQIERPVGASDLDKWRLAFLSCIEASNDTDDEKISRLQEVYADFDYPEDMASCSIYSQDSLPPLIAMHNIIKFLRGKYSL